MLPHRILTFTLVIYIAKQQFCAADFDDGIVRQFQFAPTGNDDVVHRHVVFGRKVEEICLVVFRVDDDVAVVFVRPDDLAVCAFGADRGGEAFEVVFGGFDLGPVDFT